MADIRQIQVIPSQIERTAGNGGVTLRGTSANLSYNKNLLQKLQAIVNKDWTQDDSLFDDGQLPVVTIEELQKLLTQVVIRFDNDPNYYTKRDYYYLIWYLCESLIYITNTGQASVDSLTALQTQIDALIPRLDGVDSQITSILNQLAAIDVTSLDNRVSQLEQQVQQGLLTAGSGIAIDSTNVISAVYTEPTFYTTVKVGGLDANSEIKQGDNIVDILKKILNKLVDVIRTDPKVSLTLDITEAELGSTPTIQGTVRLTDGYYDPAEQGTMMSRQYMQCQLEDPILGHFTTFQNNGTTMTLTGTANIVGNTTMRAQVSVTSQNPGLMSDGKTVSAQSQDTFTFPLQANIKAYRYLYIGQLDFIGQSLPAMNNMVVSLTNNDLTKLTKLYSDQSKVDHTSPITIPPSTSVVIACPLGYKLSKVIDGDSLIDVVGQYKLYSKTIRLNCGGTHTEDYKLYLKTIFKTTANLNIASITFEKET